MSREHHSPCEEALAWVHAQGAGVHRYMGKDAPWVVIWGKLRVRGRPIMDREFHGATLVEAVEHAKEEGPDDGQWREPRAGAREGGEAT